MSRLASAKRVAGAWRFSSASAGDNIQLRIARQIPLDRFCRPDTTLQVLYTVFLHIRFFLRLPKCRSVDKHPPLWCCGRVSVQAQGLPWRLTYVGTDQSQGRGQIISNINACLAVQSTIKGTLGPYGGDLLMVDENGKQTITNDGATVMKVTQWKIHWDIGSLTFSAPRYRPPRRPRPYRYRKVARRRSWRRNHVSCRYCWRDPERDQGFR